MSFLYGLERRTNFSPFQFDKIYKNRKTMDESCSDDGIYIGRYVLISYGKDEFIKDPQYTETRTQPLFVTQPNQNNSNNFDYSDTSSDLHSISISSEQILSEQIIATKSDEDFQANLKTDLEEYGNSYHNTVWMKVYRNATEEYIMIAELNAKAPQLGIEVKNPAIKAYTQSDSGSQVQATETWQDPYFDLSKSSDLYYTLQMPKTLRYFTAKPEIAVEGFDYKYRNKKLDSTAEMTANFNPDNNTMLWQYGQAIADSDGKETFQANTSNDGNNASAKELETNLPALGQIASLLYDILFGIPTTAGGQRPGTKPSAINLIEQVLGEDLGNPNNGLLLLLDGIFNQGKWQPDWKRSIDDSGSILNKPYVIYDSTNGDDAGHKKLNLSSTTVATKVYQ